MSEWKETEIGQIPKEWDIIPLTKAIDKYIDNRGKTVPVTDEPTDIVLIATNCIKEDSLYPVKEKIRYVPDDVYKNWFRAHPLPGDIIIVNKGTPGLVCFVPEKVDFCIAQDMVALRINNEILYNKYLFAFMRSRFFKWQVYSLNVGTTIPHLKKTNFNELLIPKPPVNEQIKIGELYFILSKKIDLLHRQNKKLEAIAQALFKRWFVDFEFPDENGQPYKSSGGKMVPSELGEIPEGWQNGEINEIANVTDYVANGSFESLRKNVRLYDEKEFAIYVRLVDFNNNFLSNLKYADKQSYNFLKKSKLMGHEIIISNIGANAGTIFRPPKWLNKPMTLGSNSIMFNADVYTEYLYYLLTGYIGKAKLKGIIGGSAQPKFNKTDFRSIDIIVPKKKLVERFNKIAIIARDKIFSNKRTMSNLIKTRETLLPKLMNGKIRFNK
jgi:type I restriction enzyme S subunit